MDSTQPGNRVQFRHSRRRDEVIEGGRPRHLRGLGKRNAEFLIVTRLRLSRFDNDLLDRHRKVDAVARAALKALEGRAGAPSRHGCRLPLLDELLGGAGKDAPHISAEFSERVGQHGRVVQDQAVRISEVGEGLGLGGAGCGYPAGVHAGHPPLPRFQRQGAATVGVDLGDEAAAHHQVIEAEHQGEHARNLVGQA